MRHVDFIRFFHKSHMALMSSEHLQAHRSTSGIFTGANGNNREVTTEYRGYPKCLWTFDLHDFKRCKIHLITNDKNQTFKRINMIFRSIMLYCLNLWYNRKCGSVTCHKTCSTLRRRKTIYRSTSHDINIVMGWNGGDVSSQVL